MSTIIEELVRRIEPTKQKSVPQDLEDAKLQAKKELVEINGREKFFKLRSKWSWCIITWISTLIFFHIAITFLLGMNILDYQGYSWFLPTLLLENFLQIIGMGYIVVNFLYHKT